MADKKGFASLENGKISYNLNIVKGIVQLAVSNVSGIAYTLNKRGEKVYAQSLKLKEEADGIRAEVEIIVNFGYDITDVAYNVQQSIIHNVEAMSNYKIAKVDVHIVNVEFPDSIDED